MEMDLPLAIDCLKGPLLDAFRSAALYLKFCYCWSKVCLHQGDLCAYSLSAIYYKNT